MPQPTFAQVHVDSLLTSMAIAHMGDPSKRHFARRCATLVPVDKPTGKYSVFDRAAFQSRGAQKRTPGTKSARVGFGVSTDTFNVVEIGAACPIPDEIKSAWDHGLTSDRAAIAVVSSKIMLEEDYNFAANFLTTSVWTGQTDQTGVAAAPGANQFLQFNDPASDPIGVFRSAIRALTKQLGGLRPNRLLLGPEPWDEIQDHPDVLARLSTNSNRILTEDAFASLLGLPPGGVICLEESYNSAKENATVSMSHVVGKVAWLGYVSPKPPMEEPTAMSIFHWSEFDGAAKAGAPTIRRHREEQERQDVLEGNAYSDQKVTASVAGCFFTSVVA